MLLGALVRNVFAGRGETEQHRDVVPFPARLVVRGRRRAIAWRWSAFAATAVGAGLVALALLRFWSSPPVRYTVSGQRIHFSDGSDITFGRDGHVSVLGVTTRGAHVRLDAGSARIRLLGKPGGPRWSVDAGPYTLATAGSDLELGWAAGPATISVSVRSGRVVVRGPLGNRREVRLAPDQVLVARASDRSWHLDSGRAQSDGRCPQSEASSLAVTEAWLRLDERGCLGYGHDDNGNRMPDFSYAGYHGGGVGPPFVPRARDRLPLAPGKSGDDTAALQAALDQVAAQPPGPDGVRGAVELAAGTFTLAGSVRILGSGVVLRGQGTTGPGATVLRAVGVARPVLIIGPASERSVAASHRVMDHYVPVGGRSFELDDIGDLQVGDDILVRRPSMPRWLDVVGMFSRAAGVVFERRISDIQGRRITVDVPLTNALEKDYTEGTVAKYRFADRVTEVGIERLASSAQFDPRSDLGDGIFIEVDAATNTWVRQVLAEGYEAGAVSLEQPSKWVTVEDVTSLAPVPPPPTGWSRAFLMGGQQNLLLRGRAVGATRAFETWGRTAGPNVVLDLTVIGKSSVVKPSRWTNGLLLDGVHITDQTGEPSGAIVIDNQGRGREIGWSGANSVVWNCRAGRFVIDSPPTAQNWVMGGQADEIEGNAIHDPVARPDSLYRAQLAERLGDQALGALSPGAGNDPGPRPSPLSR
jgi:hypothetical protein